MSFRSILCLLVCATVVLGEPKKYIVGGRSALISNHPYQVSLRMDGKHFCGASIISDYYLLTAAHCTRPHYIPKITICVGTQYQFSSCVFQYLLRRAIVHESFNRVTALCDIALLEVHGPITFNALVQPIALATFPPSADLTGTITGWGFTDLAGTQKQNQINVLQVRIIGIETCKKFNPIYPADPHCLVTDSHVCTLNFAGQGVCQGDSGGPLVAGGVQYGVVSFVAAKCAIDLPDVYTSVAYYRRWIYEKSGV